MTAILNDWAAAWANFMWRGVVDAALLLVILLALWMPLRRRLPAQVGYCLFLFVLLKLVVPLSFPVPGWLAYLSPHYSIEKLTAWVARPPARPVALSGGPLSTEEDPAVLRPTLHGFHEHGAGPSFEEDG